MDRDRQIIENPIFDAASEKTTSNVFDETLFAEPQMMDESIVDSHVASPPTNWGKESRGYIMGFGSALFAVAVLGVIALVISLGKSDSNGALTVPTEVTSPVTADSNWVSRVDFIETLLNQSLTRIATLEEDGIAKVCNLLSIVYNCFSIIIIIVNNLNFMNFSKFILILLFRFTNGWVSECVYKGVNFGLTIVFKQITLILYIFEKMYFCFFPPFILSLGLANCYT